jgi:hypothetical protein
MTLLGKVFVVLTAVFSVLFFALSIAINATHNNWRNAVLDPNSGFKAKNTQLTNNVEELKTSLSEAQLQLAEEQAARRVTLASLQTALDAQQAELATKTRELEAKQSEATTQTQTLQANANELQRLGSENEEVKARNKTLLEDRNGQRSKVVSLTDELNQLAVLYNTLESRRVELNDQSTLLQARLDSARGALAAAGIDEDPDDVAPPNLEGIVQAVGRNGRVEVSVGTDDGLRVGHQMSIVRGGKYIGRIEIELAKPDRSVGKIVDGTRVGNPQIQDRVMSRL